MPKKEIKIKLKNGRLYFNEEIIAQIQDNHIHFCLDYLKNAGFEGKIIITENRFSQENKMISLEI